MSKSTWKTYRVLYYQEPCVSIDIKARSQNEAISKIQEEYGDVEDCYELED